jgi:hypothetical protein
MIILDQNLTADTADSLNVNITNNTVVISELGFGMKYADNSTFYEQLLESDSSSVQFSTIQSGLTLPLYEYQRFKYLISFATKNTATCNEIVGSHCDLLYPCA